MNLSQEIPTNYWKLPFAGLWAGNSPEVDEARNIAIQELVKEFELKVPNNK